MAHFIWNFKRYLQIQTLIYFDRLFLSNHSPKNSCVFPLKYVVLKSPAIVQTAICPTPYPWDRVCSNSSSLLGSKGWNCPGSWFGGWGWGMVTGKIEHTTGTMKVLFFMCIPLLKRWCLCKCQFGKSKLHFEFFLFPGWTMLSLHCGTSLTVNRWKYVNSNKLGVCYTVLVF